MRKAARNEMENSFIKHMEFSRNIKYAKCYQHVRPFHIVQKKMEPRKNGTDEQKWLLSLLFKIVSDV